jgi:hypothetical protein
LKLYLEDFITDDTPTIWTIFQKLNRKTTKMSLEIMQTLSRIDDDEDEW